MGKKSLVGMILAIVGLILGVVGIAASGITSWIGIVLCIVGLILSATGTKPFKIIGIIIGAIGIVVGIICGIFGCTKCAAKQAANALQQASENGALDQAAEDLFNQLGDAIESGLEEATQN